MHGLFAARVRPPLASLQRLRDRPVPRRPVAQRSYPHGCRPGGRTNRHALPARPVLGPPFSATGAYPGSGTGAAGGDHSGGGLRLHGPADARIHRLDLPPPLPVFPTPLPPALPPTPPHSAPRPPHPPPPHSPPPPSPPQ